MGSSGRCFRAVAPPPRFPILTTRSRRNGWIANGRGAFVPDSLEVLQYVCVPMIGCFTVVSGEGSSFVGSVLHPVYDRYWPSKGAPFSGSE